MQDDFIGKDNVVTLTSDSSARLHFPELAEIERYWDELRGDDLVPCRSSVDPRRISSLLSRAFILERLAPGVARFRLAGSRLNDLMGMEVRGMPLSCIFLPEARAQIASALERVFAGPARVRLTLTGDRGIGKPPLDAVLLLLPLASESGEITRALGCLAMLGPTGRAPRRFRIRHVCQAPADPRAAGRSGRAREWEDAEASHPAPEPAAELAEPAAVYTPPPPRTKPDARPHLYLVKSDDD